MPIHATIGIAILWMASAQHPFSCNENHPQKRPYGPVELHVECSYLEDRTDNNISVLEYKPGGQVQHGISLHYDSLWRKRDSSFFVNGKEEGLGLFWDTLGNVIGRETLKHGHHVGKRESYFSPGRPAVIKNYNDQGKEDGPWQEWWKNGNKKGEFQAKNGRIISGTEYYQDGRPRLKYSTKYDPNAKWLERKRVDAESWTPNGKSAGRIEKGNGEWVLFPDGSDSTDHSVFHEVYKDSVMVKAEKLDPAEVAKLLKP